MKDRSLPLALLKSIPVVLALAARHSLADTVLNFETIPPGQFHNIAIIQSFGDNASSSSPGVSVTGIGTPDIGLTWSAVSAVSDTLTRWEYYSIASESFWRLGQLNRCLVGDYFDLKFTPGNSASAAIKSFNFHGYYGITAVSGTNYQERFTFNWEVLDELSLTSLTNGSYTFLSDGTKDHPININYTGANNQALILRLTRVASTLGSGSDPVEVEGLGADIGVDDITFSEEIGASDVAVTSVSPNDGQTNVSPEFSYRATISDGFLTQINAASIQLRLNGLALSPTITKIGLVTTIQFSAGGLMRNGSTNKYTLTFNDNAGSPGSHTNEVSFVVRYNSYEWNFQQGDLSAAVGGGIMEYADSQTPGLTSFGTTDGSTVPHIGGMPAKFMHVPAFTSDTEGYHLTLNDSGPNVGTNAYINRYTVLFDLLIPGPMNYLPFFNTDPYNLNDADFYLYDDASIGIGGGGYSSPGTIAVNTWYRIAFVADLAANTLTYYVNGTQVKSRAADGFGGRWSLYSSDDFGPDLLLFNEGDTSGIYTHELYVSSVAFTDRALNSTEATALSGPNANGIFAPSFTPAPAAAIQAAGNNVTISWPTNLVGYALEQAFSLTGSGWLPVWGVTNNSITIPSGGPDRYFRLAQ